MAVVQPGLCINLSTSSCLTSCRLQVHNIFVFIRQMAPIPACWLFKTSATSWPLTIWPWNWCPSDVDYLCANFSLPRPLCSRVRPDIRDRRQTKASLMPPPYGDRGIKSWMRLVLWSALLSEKYGNPSRGWDGSAAVSSCPLMALGLVDRGVGAVHDCRSIRSNHRHPIILYI